MAVLHQAFRCPVTPEFQSKISKLLAAWTDDDRGGLSALALAGFGALSQREDIHTAFYLHPDGAVASWMQPEFISPGLAAITMLADDFIPIRGLSASRDTNHYLLETQLPLLGWSPEEIAFLVHGQPIEVMLQGYAAATAEILPGGFRHTGGWTHGATVQKLRKRLDELVRGIPKRSDEPALSLLKDNDALSDAQAMLAEITDSDWLIMAIIH